MKFLLLQIRFFRFMICLTGTTAENDNPITKSNSKYKIEELTQRYINFV